MKNSKKEFGQFYTTKAEYIIGNLLSIIREDTTIIDPFAGNWDLLNIVKNNQKLAFDIAPQNNKTTEQDTLNNPPNYDGKWVITNPPYLAQNKTKNKSIYEKYKLDDLYKIAIKTILSCDGGILIVPLNFFCEEKSIIREEFLSKFKINKLNIFEEKVFDDTSYTVCSFNFIKSNIEINEQKISVEFFPSLKTNQFIINKKSNFRLGFEFYEKIEQTKNKYKIGRLLNGDIPNSNIKLRAIDGGGENNKIKLEFSEEPYFDKTPKKSERTFATIVLPFKLSKDKQMIIIEQFNSILNDYREKYNSLFLTNFRNSTSLYARKRISFDAAYKLINYILNSQHNNLL